jgi:hypothetical protein
MIQRNSINRTKVQKQTEYQTRIELLSDNSFFEMLYNIIPRPKKGTNVQQRFCKSLAGRCNFSYSSLSA